MWPRLTVSANPGNLVELADDGPQVGVVDEAPTVALEVTVVHSVEADARREQSPVGFRDTVAHQVAVLRQAMLDPVQGRKQSIEGFFVCILRGGESGAVDAVVNRGVDSLVDAIDVIAEFCRIKVAGLGFGLVERTVEHPND